MRFLILCILIYAAYRAFKALIIPRQPGREVDTEGERARIDDVMVKDPFCETYFPARSGIKEVIKGETFYFCSRACRDKYMERIKQA